MNKHSVASSVKITSRVCSKVNAFNFPAPVVQRKAVIVDGLNILTRLRAFRVESLSEKNSRKRKINPLFYQYKEEVIDDVEYIYSFFKYAFDDDTDIHFVIKKYGKKHMAFWHVLVDSLIDIFGSKFNFRLYCALDMDDKDKECDDRFTLRLGLKLQSENNSVYILSQDKFRSIDSHWFLDSDYYELTGVNSPIRTIKCKDYSRNMVSTLNFTQYEYYWSRYDNINMELIM